MPTLQRLRRGPRTCAQHTKASSDTSSFLDAGRLLGSDWQRGPAAAVAGRGLRSAALESRIYLDHLPASISREAQLALAPKQARLRHLRRTVPLAMAVVRGRCILQRAETDM